jgi:hypothetical protein
MFRVPGHIFGGTEGVGYRLHVLRARTRFRRYRRRQVSFSCSALPSTFLTVSRASGLVFMFSMVRRALGHDFMFALPFSCFVLLDSFSAVPRASGPDFVFYAPGLIFGGTEGVRSRFHVLRSQTHFRRCRLRRVPFSCFVNPDSFSAVPRASNPVFMFCAPELVLDGAEGVRSRFHVLRSRTRFRRYRRRRVRFSYFAFPDSFSAVPRAFGLIFKFCVPGLVLGGVDCIGSRFHVLRA